jgi:nitroreductase
VLTTSRTVVAALEPLVEGGRTWPEETSMTARPATDQTPTDSNVEEAFYAAVDAARHAPSLHNAQPWRWRIAGRLAELYTDTTRAIPVADPLGREMRLSCGAALELARITLATAGWHAVVTRLPDPTRPDLIARVQLAGRMEPAAETKELAAAIPLRRSDRRPFAPDPVPDTALEALVSAAQHENTGLLAITDPDRRVELAVLADEAAKIQESDPGYEAELARWTGTRPDAAGVIPEGVPDLDAPRHTDVPLRDWTLHPPGALPIAAGVDEHPVWCLLATTADAAADQIRAGEALARVLLTATNLGLATSVQSQPVEVPGIRTQVEHWLLANLGHLQALIRVGRPDPAAGPLPPAPRRAITDILTTD